MARKSASMRCTTSSSQPAPSLLVKCSALQDEGRCNKIRGRHVMDSVSAVGGPGTTSRKKIAREQASLSVGPSLDGCTAPCPGPRACLEEDIVQRDQPGDPYS